MLITNDTLKTIIIVLVSPHPTIFFIRLHPGNERDILEHIKNSQMAQARKNYANDIVLIKLNQQDGERRKNRAILSETF